MVAQYSSRIIKLAVASNHSEEVALILEFVLRVN